MSRPSSPARRWLGRLLALVLLLGLSAGARAEPYLAMRTGLKCVNCHVNPTGGGLRNSVGVAFSQSAIPAHQLPEFLQGWTGGFADILRLGGDYRWSDSHTEVPGLANQDTSGVEQLRLYADLQILKDRLGLYLDQQVEPGQSTREEGYVRLSTPGLGVYAKVGQFYLPFGWRLQDQSAFVRQLSGINMTTPDRGIEIGTERPNLSAQLVFSDGPGNKGDVTGHQITSQVVWLQPWGRIGSGAAFVQSSAGNRQALTVFGGTRTGPVAWLGEVDWVADSGYPEGKRRQIASLFEGDWLMAQGHNFKFTYEYLNPDIKVHNDQEVRYSFVYEYTPIAFIQVRAGVRIYDGIPQNAFDNRRLTFVELHGLF
jgi:hypothetical protein